MDKKTYSETDLRYFDQFTSGYTPYRDSDLDTMLRTLDHAFEHFKKPRICEIGCASGQFSQALMRRYPGSDMSLTGVDIALNVLSFYPYRKICGSAFALPFRDKSFELVCLPATLHHLFPLEDSLKEVTRVLVSGGVFYCMEPNYLHPHRYFFMRFARLYQLYRKANDVPIHPLRLQKYLEKINMTVLECRFVNIYFKEPSLLQKMQNIIADLMPNTALSKYWLPWFILIAKKVR
ncbi:MAG: class I SAM-dependent methyltransferase [Deltaproteobacteria bacterium]|nr:MAG: class I SAM-dependent methyltransferase [Deltaproteobacteria bacterium]